MWVRPLTRSCTTWCLPTSAKHSSPHWCSCACHGGRRRKEPSSTGSPTASRATTPSPAKSPEKPHTEAWALLRKERKKGLQPWQKGDLVLRALPLLKHGLQIHHSMNVFISWLSYVGATRCLFQESALGFCYCIGLCLSWVISPCFVVSIQHRPRLWCHPGSCSIYGVNVGQRLNASCTAVHPFLNLEVSWGHFF